MSSELKCYRMVQFVLSMRNLALYFSRIAELPVQYSSRPDHCSEAGVTLAYGQIYQNYSLKPDRAPGLIDKTILIESFHFLTFVGINHSSSNMTCVTDRSPFLEVVLLCAFRHVDM